ncbi:NADH-quinone oxidoreductase subunit M [Paenibacillus chitinolyticus]|uniref:NADH-quinone oxidoreductase subunit M n=1 Tax=Paenibacillus chitinolyticus TaxID=79263 RepID=A0A410WQL4_9BACL|nr:NADH-quinone oxidoreductase subunit M [Paenibacillus chitinolyticus]MCY9591729.1 NADH-quinone oxidoreductase subunit M [Paenibacillus chitinolyticus]MCY9596088.1 NADH-quinone oxidoreductase subunit M [Paenibacillus chitinolyticus]QAV16624.1 NADH-quinone oxidoreductase subunit M [Paenibacillus chitinolyticus]
MSANLLSLIVFSPLLGILVLLFLPKENKKALQAVCVAATGIPLLLSAWLYAAYSNGVSGMQFKEQLDWIRIPLNKEGVEGLASFYWTVQYHLAVDGLSMPLVFLTALVFTMAALASIYIKKRWKAYSIWLLLLEVGVFGVFTSQDLFLFFLFFEVTLVPMFFLIGIWGRVDREKAASRFLIYNGLGSAVMLVAFVILVTTAGISQQIAGNQLTVFYSGDIQTIVHNLLQDPTALVNQVSPNPQAENPFFLSEGMKTVLLVMLLIAFGIKLPIFPFHTWMLKVHTEAPPPVVMIHSGILLKMGAYGLIRFGILLFPAQAQDWAWVLALLGVINILYGALLAFVQNEFRLVLAYSSISHMGIVLLGLAAFNPIGMQGAIFQLVSHGLISALMFLLVGSIYERTSTTELGKLGGLAKSMPFLSAILLVGGLASLGLPGLSGFVSELLAFIGLFGTARVLTIIGAVGIILTAAYVLRGVMKMTYGPLPERFRELPDARFIEAVPMIALVAFILLLGVYPGILSEPLQQTVNGFHQTIHSLAGKIGG